MVKPPPEKGKRRPPRKRNEAIVIPLGEGMDYVAAVKKVKASVKRTDIVTGLGRTRDGVLLVDLQRGAPAEELRSELAQRGVSYKRPASSRENLLVAGVDPESIKEEVEEVLNKHREKSRWRA